MSLRKSWSESVEISRAVCRRRPPPSALDLVGDADDLDLQLLERAVEIVDLRRRRDRARRARARSRRRSAIRRRPAPPRADFVLRPSRGRRRPRGRSRLTCCAHAASPASAMPHCAMRVGRAAIGRSAHISSTWSHCRRGAARSCFACLRVGRLRARRRPRAGAAASPFFTCRVQSRSRPRWKRTTAACGKSPVSGPSCGNARDRMRASRRAPTAAAVRATRVVRRERAAAVELRARPRRGRSRFQSATP